MFTRDHNIDVDYLLVLPGSKCHEDITAYREMAIEFCQKAEALVEKHGADSAVMGIDGTSQKVIGLNFLPNQSRPYGWSREAFNYYYTPHKRLCYVGPSNAIQGIELPYLHEAFPLWGFLHYSTLGEDIYAARTKKDIVSLAIDGTKAITAEEMQAAKDAAIAQGLQADVDAFVLHSSKWPAVELIKSPVFHESEALRADRKAYWDNCWRNGGPPPEPSALMLWNRNLDIRKRERKTFGSLKSQAKPT